MVHLQIVFYVRFGVRTAEVGIPGQSGPESIHSTCMYI